MVKMDVSVHNVFPGNSGRIGRVALANILGPVKDISFQDHFIFIDPLLSDVSCMEICLSEWLVRHVYPFKEVKDVQMV